jgi:hypothetical protein
MRLQAVADRLDPDGPGVALVGRGAHLDELVRLERAVDLGDHLVGEALVADDHDRRELMGLGAQLAAPFRGEWGHRRSISKTLFDMMRGCSPASRGSSRQPRPPCTTSKHRSRSSAGSRSPRAAWFAPRTMWISASRQDLEDIRALLRANPDNLDMREVREYVRLFDRDPQLDELLGEIR